MTLGPAARGSQRPCVALCLSGAFAAMSSVAAHAQTFDAKPGAWETTVTTSGMTVPPEMLARMSPEKRAAIEERMGAIGAGQSQVRRSCVGQADLQKGFVPVSRAGCTVKPVSRTSTKLVMTTTCTAPVPSTGTMTWEAKTPESVIGTIDQDVGGRKVHVDVVSRWLGADCSGIAPLNSGH